MLFWRVVAGLAVMVVLEVAEARPMDALDHAAVMESLSSVHPRWRGRWLDERGLEMSGWNTPLPPPGSDSLGLREVGRWSYGTAYDVDGLMSASDTLLAYARGSGVSLLRYSRSAPTPLTLLADINCAGLVSRVAIRDSLLYIGSTSSFESWSIANPAAPHRLSELVLPVNDFALDDSLACIIGADDTFRVFSVADPAQPRLLGSCRDSGYGVVTLDGYAYVGDRYGLYVLDVRTPSAPRRVGSWGGDVISLAARNATCYVTTGNPNQPEELNFHVLDVSSPAVPVRIGGINGVGGYEIDLADTFAYLSGYYIGGHEFRVLSIVDSSNPAVLGSAATIAFNFGVWARQACGRAFVADERGGLALIDIADPAQPQPDTVILRAGSTEDIAIDGQTAYVASQLAGMKALDVSDPTRPEWVGDLTQSYRGITVFSVAARDSFAYVCWLSPFLRVVSVADPSNPMMVAACTTLNHPEAMVIRDSFLYVAEDYRFDVLNVARPRQPRVVGTVNLPGMSREVILADTLAFVAGQGMHVISVANPTNPRIIGLWDRYARGIDLQGTILYAVTYTNSTEDVLVSLDVRNPASPAVIDSVIVPRTMHDVAVVDTVAYCVGWEVQLASVADPTNLRLLPNRWSPPSWVRRVVYGPPYIYMCATDAGVSIFETLSVGVGESRHAARQAPPFNVIPTVTRGIVRLTTAGSRPVRICLADASGRVLWRRQAGLPKTLDLTGLPDGIYFVSLAGQTTARVRVTKVTRR
jgi:hypothetical protein